MVESSPEEAAAFGALGHEAMNAIANLPVPVIAAINGFALGGGLELALACDLLYASDKAKLGLPEVSLGVIPGWGGTQRLGRLIGWHHAQQLVYSGRMLKADEAKAIGLVLDVFPHDELQSSVLEIARAIAKNGPLAVRKAKAVMRAGSDTTLSEGLTLEQQGFADLFGTADQREGMGAFLERRPAQFTRT
jgi:enoyl-CoA hydratase